MDVSAITEQFFHRMKNISAFHTASPASGLGVCKELGRDPAGTADASDIPDHTTSRSAIKGRVGR